MTTPPSRRQFLRWGATGAGTVAAFGVGGHLLDDSARSETDTTGSSRPTVASPSDRRVLVVVELDGGNDGLSTVVPRHDGRYRDLRPTLAIGDDELVDLADGFGLHHHLSGVVDHGLAALLGVGSSDPDLSHFEMQARWWAGAPSGGGWSSGFLGRLCDQLSPPTDDPEAPPLAGVSVSSGPSPAIQAESAPTASVGGPDAFGLVSSGDRGRDAATRRCLRRLSDWDSGDELLVGPKHGLAGVLRIAGLLERLPDVPDDRYPDEDFARQLGFVSQLIRADAGVRVVHVPMAGGAFDTHDGHRESHTENMRILGSGLRAFLSDLADHGLADRVLVATTSEFGRRAREHHGGLDHGTASCALLMGPVRPGVHGEMPSLRHLDDDQNLIATVEFDRYLATLATWLDVDPEAVLADDVTAIDGLLVV